VKKVAIIVAGAGACGKTTTTQAFAVGNPEMHKELRVADLRHGPKEVPVNWTLYENCAVTGNHQSGTDSNTGPGLVEISFYECMKERDVVITDGMVSSPRWVTMVGKWADSHPEDDISIMLIHYDLDPEEVLNRLARRRGVNKESIRVKMFPKCDGLTHRAELLVRHVYNLWPGDIWHLTIGNADTTDEIVEAMDSMLCEIFGDCYEET